MEIASDLARFPAVLAVETFAFCSCFFLHISSLLVGLFVFVCFCFFFLGGVSVYVYFLIYPTFVKRLDSRVILHRI